MYTERFDDLTNEHLNDLPHDLPEQVRDFQPAFHFPGEPAPNRRKGFLIGLGSVLACGFVALAVFFTLSHHVRTTFHQVYGKVNPPRIDVEAAKARLRQAGKTPDLTFPFPSPRIVVCQEFSELDLFSGERFVKRYKVRLGQVPQGNYVISTHALPQGRDILSFGLTPAPLAGLAAPSATGTPAVSATSAVPASVHASAPVSGALSIQGLGPMENFTGAVALSENEAAELFVATQAGSPVRIEK